MGWMPSAVLDVLATATSGESAKARTEMISGGSVGIKIAKPLAVSVEQNDGWQSDHIVGSGNCGIFWDGLSSRKNKITRR